MTPSAPSGEGPRLPRSPWGNVLRRPPVWLPEALVIFALLSSVVTPTILRWREHVAVQELQEVVNPARTLVAEMKSALERTISTRAAFQISGDSSFLARSARWDDRNRRAAAGLAVLVRRLGPDVQREWAAVQARDAELKRLTAPRPEAGTTRRAGLMEVDDRVEALLAASDRLDAELERESDARQERLQLLGQRGWLVNLLLALLGVAAILSVARLTRREQRARALAEAAVRSRDEVVSIVSHDLRNPLGAVSMSAEFLLEILPATDERRSERRQMEIIHRAAQNMNRMIQDLLDIARIESGRLTVERAPVPVAALMDEAEAMLRPLVERQGQRFECEVPDGVSAVYADRDRMLQVFSNLVGNAVKFTPAGGVVRLAAEPDGTAIRFRVSDTGTGIPAEHVPHLFDRFWQATRSDRRGIGLGLPIVQGLVEAHGGRVVVESTPGQGSTFSFTLDCV